MSYITIADIFWSDGTNNETRWNDEQIVKKGKYYHVEKPDYAANLIRMYRIWWSEDDKDWQVEYKLRDKRTVGNRIHWQTIKSGPYRKFKFETDLKPIIPKKKKKKIYGSAVITWAKRVYSGKVIQNNRLVQFHYRKDGCYYFKTPPLDIDCWKDCEWRMNEDLKVEIKNYGYNRARWQQVKNHDYCPGVTPVSWAKVVSADIY